jgi:hypothetical protein
MNNNQKCVTHNTVTKEQAETLNYIKWSGYILTPLIIGSMLIKVSSSPTGLAILTDALSGFAKVTCALAVLATLFYFSIKGKGEDNAHRSLSLSLFGMGVLLSAFVYSGVGFYKGAKFIQLKVDHLRFVESTSDVGNMLLSNTSDSDTSTMVALDVLGENNAMITKFLFTIEAAGEWAFLYKCIPIEEVDTDISVAKYVEILYQYDQSCAPT